MAPFFHVEPSALSLGGSDDFQCSNGHFFSHSLKNAAVFNHSNYKTESFTTSRVAQLDWPQPLHWVPSSKSPGRSAKMSGGKSSLHSSYSRFVSPGRRLKTPRNEWSCSLEAISFWILANVCCLWTSTTWLWKHPPLARPFDSWGDIDHSYHGVCLPFPGMSMFLAFWT